LAHLECFSQEGSPGFITLEYRLPLNRDHVRECLDGLYLDIDRWVVETGANDACDVFDGDAPLLEAVSQYDWSIRHHLESGPSMPWLVGTSQFH
jgi:hypothetical protein